MKFFNPTPDLKELLLLQHIEEDADTSQHKIAKVIGGAASMVNVYIDKLEENGYLIRDYQSAKIVYYNITPEGIKRKNYLLISYMRELLDLYKLAKNNVEIFLNKLTNKGYKNVLLYGAGEVAETIIGVIRDGVTDLNIVAIVDDNSEKHNKELLNYKIISPDKINELKHDAIIVTSYTFENKILNRLKEVAYEEDKVVRFFGE